MINQQVCENLGRCKQPFKLLVHHHAIMKNPLTFLCLSGDGKRSKKFRIFILGESLLLPSAELWLVRWASERLRRRGVTGMQPCIPGLEHRDLLFRVGEAASSSTDANGIGEELRISMMSLLGC